EDVEIQPHQRTFDSVGIVRRACVAPAQSQISRLHSELVEQAKRRDPPACHVPSGAAIRHADLQRVDSALELAGLADVEHTMRIRAQHPAELGTGRQSEYVRPRPTRHNLRRAVLQSYPTRPLLPTPQAPPLPP